MIESSASFREKEAKVKGKKKGGVAKNEEVYQILVVPRIMVFEVHLGRGHFCKGRACWCKVPSFLKCRELLKNNILQKRQPCKAP